MVVEHLSPIQETLVGSHDQTGPLITPHHQAEEKAGLLPGDGEIANLVHDEQLGVGQSLERPLQAVLMAGLAQAGHQGFQGKEEHGIAGFQAFTPKATARRVLPTLGNASPVRYEIKPAHAA